MEVGQQVAQSVDVSSFQIILAGQVELLAKIA